jgi:hypothetical protein
MTFTPTAERPGLRTQQLKRDTSTTLAPGWILERDFVNKITAQPKSLYVDSWFRRGADFMRAGDSAVVHCKFGDEHLGLLDPGAPTFDQIIAQYRTAGEASDGLQWGPNLLVSWCEFSGMIVDGLKISHGMRVEDSYIHDLMRIRTDFYTRLGNATDLFTHNDGVQCLQAPATYGPVAVRRSLIVMRQEHMSCFMVKPDSADIGEFIIEDNYLSAKNCIFAISGTPKGKLRKLTVRRNTFNKKSVMWALMGTYLHSNETQIVWEDNHWDDGKPLSLADALKNPTPR